VKYFDPSLPVPLQPGRAAKAAPSEGAQSPRAGFGVAI
jgi:hypothetical protein